MNIGKVKDAERFGLNCLDKWNDVTGAVAKNSGWYYELQSVIEDAVHVGIHMALFGEVKTNDEGEIVKHDNGQDNAAGI
mgnify:FL=1